MAVTEAGSSSRPLPRLRNRAGVGREATRDLPGIPGTRAARHALIENLLQRGSYASQAELSQALAEHGVTVAQGTLSRDLEALRAVKVRGADGSLVYRVPEGAADWAAHTHNRGPRTLDVAVASDERLRRWCGDLLIAGEVAAHTVVLRTPPGAAQMLASALDRSALPGVLGCVGGDDTIIVVARDGETAVALLHELLSLADSGRYDNE